VPLTPTRGRPVQQKESDRLVGALCALAAIRAGDTEQGSIGMDEGRVQKRRVRAMRRQRARRL
jgi:hypothetical protein